MNIYDHPFWVAVIAASAKKRERIIWFPLQKLQQEIHEVTLLLDNLEKQEKRIRAYFIRQHLARLQNEYDALSKAHATLAGTLEGAYKERTRI